MAYTGTQKRNMQMVITAFRKAGLSDNQAKALAAEVGRENSFSDRYLWGYHADPHNRATNIGMISWQGARARKLAAYLKSQGLLDGNKMRKGQESLDAMARFLVDEIRTNPEYKQTKKLFLDNPNVDYSTANRVLGKNYIRWRYDDPKYKKHHSSRDGFYQLAQELGGGVVTSEPIAQDYQAPAPNLLSPSNYSIPSFPQPPVSQPLPYGQNIAANLLRSLGMQGALAEAQKPIFIPQVADLNSISTQSRLYNAPLFGDF